MDKGLNWGSFAAFRTAPTVENRGSSGPLLAVRSNPTLQSDRIPHAAPDAARYNIDVAFTIREFQPSDFETLWRIDQDCFSPGIAYSRTELKVYMRRRGSFTLVAVSLAAQSAVSPDSGRTTKDSSASVDGNGNIVGFIVAESGTRGSGHIITIDVTGAVRRSGVGSLLLRAAEDRLAKAGAPSVELETAVDNTSALSFYKRHGYSVIRTFPRYYSNGVDALVLQKPLPS